MKIVRVSDHSLRMSDGTYFVTLGNYDGLHLGHRKILEELKRRAHGGNGQTVAVTFDPHPRLVLDPGCELKVLTSMQHRLRLFEELGMDYTVVIEFDRLFAQQSAEDFICKLLFPAMHFKELIVGENYAFGKDRRGTVALLREFSKKLGFKVDTVDPFYENQSIVSSSWIRNCIKNGDLNLAARLLKRSYSVYARVVQGKGIGKELGYPTANLDVSETLMPPRGVYASEVLIGARSFYAMTNIGVRPTFHDDEKTESCEVHILDFSETIYHQSIEVKFVRKIRDEIKFGSTRQLQSQIKLDEIWIRQNFMNTSRP